MVPAAIVEKGRAVGVEVDMGVPKYEKPLEKFGIRNSEFGISVISMGNPHCVLFVEDVSKAPVETLGPEIENHSRFPSRTNVEFVEVVNDHELKVRVWERGAGETLACGTGACAAVVASVLNKKTGKRCIVNLPGGKLDIEWEEDNHVALRGPAEEVFKGEIEI